MLVKVVCEEREVAKSLSSFPLNFFVLGTHQYRSQHIELKEVSILSSLQNEWEPLYMKDLKRTLSFFDLPTVFNFFKSSLHLIFIKMSSHSQQWLSLRMRRLGASKCFPRIVMEVTQTCPMVTF